jgi:tetratricopeptide (TPR) repeat protein
MQKLVRKLLVFSFFLVHAMVGDLSAFAAPLAESARVAEARELLDTYYGNQANLIRSAQLLERAFEANPMDANVFVQAARITVMGGHLKFDEYQNGTFERSSALLDKAISLDPRNVQAHILKASAFRRQGAYQNQLVELDRAKDLGTNDPWLQVGYGSYYRLTNSLGRSYEAYSDVARRGPGSTASERRAYIAAIDVLRTFNVGGVQAKDKIREYAAIALKERYPTDAWTPLGYAEHFIDYHLFGDAIFYAREALKTMDFGAGRLTLAAALYARAAQLTSMGGSPKEIETLLSEARKFEFSKATILEYLLERRGIKGSLKVFAPELDKIVG